MKEADLLNWLKAQKETLDRIIAQAGEDFHNDKKDRPNFSFDLAQCQAESYYLSQNPPQDLCYDRPNTPLTYSLWYHGRRVNTFLSRYARTFFSNTDDVIELFDLGAGTGAVQWAIGLVYHFMKANNMRLPKLKIVNVDTSPFMLDYSRNYLWKHFLKYYSHCQDFDNSINTIEYHINAWKNVERSKITNAWITASYLFDISDIDEKETYKAEVLNGFQDILKLYNPSRLLLLTAKSKWNIMQDVARQFSVNEYIVQLLTNNDLIFHGTLDHVNKLRFQLFEAYKPVFTTREEASIGRGAIWDDSSFVGVYLTKKQQQIFERTHYDGGLYLHNVPVKVRNKIDLNPDQEKAARLTNQPTVIIGPAGCGKSIVLTERIKKIVHESQYDTNLHILLSTFNKELLHQLASWLAEILDPNKFKWISRDNKYVEFYFAGSNKPNITVINFDNMPKVLGGVPPYGMVNDLTHKTILTKIIREVKQRNKIADSNFDDVLNEEFLLEEYSRVIYGLQTGIEVKENYLSVSRKGRGTKLDRSKRELVWECLHQYVKTINDQHIACFIARRQAFLDRLRKGQVPISFDYIAVDEFQDCTKADFEIFFNMLNDPNNLIIAGDLAQALQLGKSANVDLLREAIRAGREMHDISWNYLQGSYRLPLRICEAVKKISEHIHTSFKKNRAASILVPYKGAPPGARPIIAYGRNTVEVAQKIRDILNIYQRFDLQQISILEEDRLLGRVMQLPSDSVLRVKGMERHCVIWSTRIPVKFKKEKFEFVHTILSRTSSILIIALFEDVDTHDSTTLEIFKEALGLLRRDRIIFWDKETKDHFDTFCAVPESSEIEDDD